MPHFLPGQNSGIGEFLKTQTWIPFEPVRGGVKTIYPEYRAVLASATRVNSLTVPVSKSANDVAKRIADQSPRDGQVHVLPVQGNIYMLVADGTNITASVGRDGIAIVNTGSAQMTDKVLAALNELAQDGGQRAGDQHLLRRELSRACRAGRARTSTPSSPRRVRRGRCATSSTPARRRSTSAATRSLPRRRRFRRGGVGGFGGAVRDLGDDGDDRRARGRAQPR